MSRFTLALALVALTACDGSTPPPGGFDAGPRRDGGGNAMDACPPCDPPAGCRYEGGSGCDCGTLVCDDGAVPPDAPTMTDAAPPPDSQTPMLDATVFFDGCAEPVCPIAPTGCTYVGDDPCVCGTLVCECGEATCAAGEYCDRGAAGVCSGAGTCTERPSLASCDEGAFDPVCGCNGTTYSSECHAHAAGVNVENSGECAPADDCRSGGCEVGQACMGCSSDGTTVYVCLPDGISC